MPPCVFLSMPRMVLLLPLPPAPVAVHYASAAFVTSVLSPSSITSITSICVDNRRACSASFPNSYSLTISISPQAPSAISSRSPTVNPAFVSQLFVHLESKGTNADKMSVCVYVR